MKVRRLVLMLVVLGLHLASTALADTTISLSQIDKSLALIAPHARSYPPVFDSDDQRKEIKRDLQDLLSLLEFPSRKISR